MTDKANRPTPKQIERYTMDKTITYTVLEAKEVLEAVDTLIKRYEADRSTEDRVSRKILAMDCPLCEVDDDLNPNSSTMGDCTLCPWEVFNNTPCHDYKQSISANLVRLHGWRIKLENIIKKGI